MVNPCGAGLLIDDREVIMADSCNVVTYILPSREKINDDGSIPSLQGLLPQIGTGFYWHNEFYRVKDVFFSGDNSADFGWWVLLQKSKDNPRKVIDPEYYK